jgi:hypothetical protein
MKSQLAVNIFRAFSFFAHPSADRIREENNNDHGNRNLSPTPRLPSRPMPVPTGWDSARFNDSRLPSSLEDWLASNEALVIH